jgi:hypothetical protein
MSGKLSGTIKKSADGTYSAAFTAIFATIFTHKSKVTLTAEPDGARWKFKGEKDLGFFSGGVYTYDGYSDGTEFHSTYDSTFDKGTFEMKRVEEAAPATAPAGAAK